MDTAPIPIITAFAPSPDGGRGLARDMRVRWALEEAGQRYDVRPVPFEGRHEAARRAGNPFGQIPTYEEDGLVLFESGAIIQHIASRHGGRAGLLPAEPNARARATAWMFAAQELGMVPEPGSGVIALSGLALMCGLHARAGKRKRKPA
jgi:glutathione S-transferase